MRHIIIVLLALLIIDPNSALAQKKKKKGGKAACKFVGVKTDGAVNGALLLPSEKSCFATQAKGEKKGFALIADIPSPSPTPTPTPTDDSSVRAFSFQLQGEQEVPEIFTDKSGECRALVASAEDNVKLICTHTVENTTAAHLHGGAAGEESGPICNSTPANGSSPFTIDCDLTSEQMTQFLAGNMYVNVHSNANPDGEIRGQTAPYVTTLRADGNQEVPVVASVASGLCVANLNAAADTLRVACTHDVVDPSAAHIHSAPRGEDGSIFCGFDSAESPIATECEMTEADLATLFAGGLYVNIHSSAFPDGEIRGQIE